MANIIAASAFRDIDLDETAVAVATAPVKVMGWSIHNSDATVIFVQFYFRPLADVTVGTTVPDFTIAVPPAAEVNGWPPGGVANVRSQQTTPSGLVVAATTTAGGATGPGANEVLANIFYALT